MAVKPAAVLARVRIAAAIHGRRPIPSWALASALRAARRGTLTIPTHDRNPAQIDPALTGELLRRGFNAQLRCAATQTRHYRTRWSGRVDEIPDLSSTGQIPVTTKDHVRSDPEAFLADTAQPAVRFHTSGTTGPPTPVWFDRREIESMYHFAAIATAGAGDLQQSDHLLVATSTRSACGTSIAAMSAILTGARLTLTGQIDPERVLTQLTSTNPGPRPTTLAVTPSYLGQLVTGAESRRVGPQDVDLRRIVVGGEIVTEGLKRRVRSCFGDRVEVLEGFGMTEIKPVDGSVCEQGHMHFDSRRGLVEVHSLAGAGPAGPGELGTLVVTPFCPFRTSTIYVRYDTNDIVTALPARPTCSLRDLPAASRPHGKRGRAIETDDGWILPRSILEAVESTPALPLPARVSYRWAGTGLDVAVHVPSGIRGARRAVGEALESHGLRIHQLVLTDDPGHLTDPLPMRCDTRD